MLPPVRKTGGLNLQTARQSDKDWRAVFVGCFAAQTGITATTDADPFPAVAQGEHWANSSGVAGSTPARGTVRRGGLIGKPLGDAPEIEVRVLALPLFSPGRAAW